MNTPNSKCILCFNNINLDTTKYLHCDVCLNVVHLDCVGNDNLTQTPADSNWCCYQCNNQHLPFSNLSDEEYYNTITLKYNLTENTIDRIQNLIIYPFSINDKQYGNIIRTDSDNDIKTQTRTILINFQIHLNVITT